METFIRTYVGEEVSELNQKEFLALAKCYREVFNCFWKEQWTEREALDTVKHSLLVTSERRPILTLAYLGDQLIGFSWIIMTSPEYISTDDMPFSLSLSKKKSGLEVVKYWFKLAEQNKALIYREVGIKKGYQFKDGEYFAAKLMIPMAQVAVDNGYDALFYWTNPENMTFRLCLGMNWHPIHFYPEDDRIIMKGSAKSLIDFSTRNLNQDPKVLQELESNKQKYFCL